MNDIEEDLDRFIKKREIQNEALKKIVGLNKAGTKNKMNNEQDN